MDTVIIKIYGPNKFDFRNWTLFLPELSRRKYSDLSPTEIKSRNSSRSYLRKFVLHPKSSNQYIPKVEVFETLSKTSDKVIYVLKISFSAPKLLYWNSIQEVGENDKQKMLSSLVRSLEAVGIEVAAETIENATVESVHICKNILLPTTIRMTDILAVLGRMDISKVIDVTETQFKNGGRVLNLYSGTIERSFYDKVSDSLRPKNKRSDKGYIDYERSFINEHKLQDREIFRYEYRIKKTQTTKREVNNFLNRDYKTQVVFKEIFTPNLIKKILLNSWLKLIDKPENQLSLFGQIDKTRLLMHIFSEAKRQDKKAHSMNNALTSYGIATAILDIGAKELKRIVREGWNKDHPERFTKKIDKASKLTAGLPHSNNITFIDNALRTYQIMSLTYLQNEV